MGARHSKRSVDISGGNKEGEEVQPLDGKLEKLEDGPKVAVNGASHAEHKAAEVIDEQVSNGDPSLPEAVAVTAEAGPSSPDEAQVESPAPDNVQPPKKKEKVKKKWSLRSLSFSKKDKTKPGKDDVAKEENEGILEGTDEKVEADHAASVNSVMSKVTEGMDEVFASVEHKVQTTQDQVEKISAKVAEKAEALVSKMEAMTIQAVDSAKEVVSGGHSQEAVAEEVTGAGSLEAPKLESAVSQAATVSTQALESAQSKLTETTTTSVTVSEPSALPEEVASTVTVVTTEITSGNLVSETVKTEVTKIVTEKHMPTVTQVEVIKEFIVGKTEDMPPPLPVSPPPASAAEIKTEVVNKVEETKGETIQAVGGGDLLESKEPQTEANQQSIPTVIGEVVADICEESAMVDGDVTGLVTQVVTEVIETSEHFVATNQIEENGVAEEIEHTEEITNPEPVKKTSETTGNAEDQIESPPEKSAEE